MVNLFAGNRYSIYSSLGVAEGKGDLKRNMGRVFETMLDPGLFAVRLCRFALRSRYHGSKCSILMLKRNSMAQISSVTKLDCTWSSASFGSGSASNSLTKFCIISFGD